MRNQVAAGDRSGPLPAAYVRRKSAALPIEPAALPIYRLLMVHLAAISTMMIAFGFALAGTSRARWDCRACRMLIQFSKLSPFLLSASTADRSSMDPPRNFQLFSQMASLENWRVLAIE